MSKYQKFIFKDYQFKKDVKELSLFYSYDNVLNFKEVYRFDFDFTSYKEEVLDRAFQLLFFMSGVSYFKMYFPPQIIIEKGEVDRILSSFLSKTYSQGLGEFMYLNKLDPHKLIDFPINSESIEAVNLTNSGQLIGIGGGKDSLVSYELLKGANNVATWSLNHKAQLMPLVERMGSRHFWVERILDQQLFDLLEQDKDILNGHIPISAIFSMVGLVVSVLTGFKDNIVSNESSASEPNLSYMGVEINHQYSKSLEYERDFQILLNSLFGSSLRYYSLLRPFSEVRIAEIFSTIGFQNYKDVFSSCNRAYRHDQNKLFWCGECPKCAFIFLALTPFTKRRELEELWRGKNLLLDEGLDDTYRQLLGIVGNKPLDCVGEVKESRAAMRLAVQIYPELKKYEFDLPKDYDFRTWSDHSMPSEVFDLLKIKLAN